MSHKTERLTAEYEKKRAASHKTIGELTVNLTADTAAFNEALESVTVALERFEAAVAKLAGTSITVSIAPRPDNATDAETICQGMVDILRITGANPLP